MKISLPDAQRLAEIFGVGKGQTVGVASQMTIANDGKGPMAILEFEVLQEASDFDKGREEVEMEDFEKAVIEAEAEAKARGRVKG